MKKLTTFIILVIFVGLSVFTSCKKESPVLPPENTFVMNNLDTNSQKNTEETYGNWFYAAANVTIWTTVINIGMIVPVTAYVEALKQTPRHISGDKWLWEYNITIVLSTYNIQLYGKFNDNDGIDWEMYISQVGGVQDFLWFTGTQNTEGNEGQWILYKNPTENHELLKIEWTRNLSDETGTIKYTNIEPNATENGGYIYYGNNQTGDYNAFYDIFNKGKDNLTEIELNTQFNNGRIKDSIIFGDEIWHCWDEQLINISCPVTSK